MAEETLELYAQIIEEISAYKRTVAAFQESSLPFHGCRTALQLSDWLTKLQTKFVFARKPSSQPSEGRDASLLRVVGFVLAVLEVLSTEAVSERDMRQRVLKRCRDLGVRLSSTDFPHADEAPPSCASGSTVDCETVLDVLRGLGCLTPSSGSTQTLANASANASLVSAIRAEWGPQLDSMASSKEQTSGSSTPSLDPLHPSPTRPDPDLPDPLSKTHVLELSAGLPLLEDPGRAFSQWRDLCYRESCLEEVEESLLRRVAGQCGVRLRPKPYHTGTRYLHSAVAEKVEAPVDVGEKGAEYTADLLFLKAKAVGKPQPKAGGRTADLLACYEASGSYAVFKRKLNAILGAQASTASVPPLRGSKEIAPLELWTDGSLGKKPRVDESSVCNYADICVRSRVLPWRLVAQEFTPVGDDAGAGGMEFESLGSKDVPTSIGPTVSELVPMVSMAPLRRASSLDAARRRTSDPLVLAPGYRVTEDNTGLAATVDEQEDISDAKMQALHDDQLKDMKERWILLQNLRKAKRTQRTPGFHKAESSEGVVAPNPLLSPLASKRKKKRGSFRIRSPTAKSFFPAGLQPSMEEPQLDHI